jgi:hypothetical protein
MACYCTASRDTAANWLEQLLAVSIAAGKTQSHVHGSNWPKHAAGVRTAGRNEHVASQLLTTVWLGINTGQE